MNFKRFWIQMRLFTLMSGEKRTEYLKRKKVFGTIGENCMIQSRKLPLYPELIYIGDNVRIASNVTFVTHDVSYKMLNNLSDLMGGPKFDEKKGKIEIGNNVFIGANSTILYDVMIGSNVIVGAGSLIVKNVPDGSVAVGVPCKKIGEFKDFFEKRKRV